MYTIVARPGSGIGISHSIIEGVGSFAPLVNAPYVASSLARYALGRAHCSIDRRIGEYWVSHGHAGKACRTAKCKAVK